VIPGPFRDAISEKAVLVYGPDRCLMGFSKATWDAMLERGGPREAEWPTAFRRLVATATEVQKEQSGRISIPDHMLEYAGLRRQGQAMILGLGTRFEIWNRDRYLEYAGKMYVAPLTSEAARSLGLSEMI